METLVAQIDPQQLGLEFGSGALIGGLIGFAAKKVAKLLAIVVGAELALFKFLEAKGYLIVRWDELSNGILHAGDPAKVAESPPGWLEAVVSTMSISAGFAGGFYAGFRRG